MSRKSKIWLGVLTFLPLVAGILFIIFFIGVLATISDNGSAPDAVALKGGLFFMMATVGLLVLLSLGLLIYYIVHAVNNKTLSSDERVLWIVLFVFVTNIAFIIYWIIKIWKAKEEIKEPMDNSLLDDKI